MKKLMNVIAIISMILIVACSEDNKTSEKTPDTGGTEVPTTKGNIVVKITDAPFPTDLIEKANVTINKIEIRKVNTETKAEEGDSGYIVLSEKKQTFNLLDLTNGVTESLVNLEVAAGSYNSIRLMVADAKIILKDKREFTLKVPSGSQSGIKLDIKPTIEVAGGLTSELLLDFDVSRSFVVQGNQNSPAGIKGFSFKPTIKVANLSESGSISGIITDNENAPIQGATVSINLGDEVQTTALTNEQGAYKVLGLSPATYTIKIEAKSFEANAVQDVEVVKGNNTKKDVTLNAATTETTEQ